VNIGALNTLDYGIFKVLILAFQIVQEFVVWKSKKLNDYPKVAESALAKTCWEL
jgi:hypothetical protein